jgi:hypothetical protein
MRIVFDPWQTTKQSISIETYDAVIRLSHLLDRGHVTIRRRTLGAVAD